MTNQFTPNAATVELIQGTADPPRIGFPGTTVLESWTLTGLPNTGSTSVLGSADTLLSSGPAVNLVSGTTYWVYAEPGGSTDTGDLWNSNSTNDVGNFASELGNAPLMLNSTGATPAFDVLGTPTSVTPLPATLPLFATGLGALGLLGWRRKRKARAGVI